MPIAPHIELARTKFMVRSQDILTREFPHKWGWVMCEYKELREKLDEISGRSIIIKKSVVKDKRTIKPIPVSSNHQYGWLAAKPEFDLNFMGPDVYKLPPIEDLDKMRL